VTVQHKQPWIMNVTALGKDNEVDLGDGMSCTSRDIQEWPEELDLREASLTKIGMYASVIAAVFAVLATVAGILAWRLPVTFPAP
jgi:hypothetical protein